MSSDNFSAQVLGVFLAETAKNVAKGSANALYNNFNTLFYSEITALDLNDSFDAEQITRQLEANPNILAAVRQKLNANPQIAGEMRSQTINVYGLSYSEVKEVALDVFKTNFISLSDKANQTARQRAEELFDNLLNEIKAKNPDLIKSFQEPSMQNALYSAQKSYAISGDKDTADLLVDILGERANENERNLKQIILDESLNIIPKLTNEHLDILSLVYSARFIHNFKVKNLEHLGQLILGEIQPFIMSVSKGSFSYKHLEYCNCVSISDVRSKIEELYFHNYRNFFTKPNKPSLTNENPQFSVDFWDEAEVINYLINLGDSMRKFVNIWNGTPMQYTTLTSVGIAIACANYKRKTGESLEWFPVLENTTSMV